MRLLDVNILVHAHRQDSERHAEIKEWLETALEKPMGVAVSGLVLSGCLRVIGVQATDTVARGSRFRGIALQS